MTPSSSSEEVQKQVEITYTAQYLIWHQDQSLQIAVATEVSVLEYYSEGIQYYRFNGSSWDNFKVSAYLYTSPGQQVVGRQYFSKWELFMPLSRATLNIVSTINMDSVSIGWTKMEVTSNEGNERGLIGLILYNT